MTMVNGGGAEEGRDQRERESGGRNHVHAMQAKTARVNRTSRLLRQVETDYARKHVENNNMAFRGL